MPDDGITPLTLTPHLRKPRPAYGRETLPRPTPPTIPSTFLRACPTRGHRRPLPHIIKGLQVRVPCVLPFITIKAKVRLTRPLPPVTAVPLTAPPRSPTELTSRASHRPTNSVGIKP